MNEGQAGELRPGIRVPRGSTLTIPVGGLVITVGDDGVPTGEVREVLVATSMWLEWLEVAFAHLAEAKAARQTLTAAVAVGDERPSDSAADREFRSCLQVVTAAVFSLDGFYSHLQEHIIPRSRSWHAHKRAPGGQRG